MSKVKYTKGMVVHITNDYRKWSRAKNKLAIYTGREDIKIKNREPNDPLGELFDLMEEKGAPRFRYARRGYIYGFESYWAPLYFLDDAVEKGDITREQRNNAIKKLLDNSSSYIRKLLGTDPDKMPLVVDLQD